MQRDNKNLEWLVLLIICLVALSIKLYFVFQTPHLESHGYFELRQVENILDKGLPTSWDELSYSGRQQAVMPAYYFLVAIFGLFTSAGIALKLVSNILVSLLPILIYFIVKKITKDSNVSYITALFSAFIPILTQTTLLTGSVHSLSLLLILLSLYFFINLKEKENLKYFLISILILSFTSSVVIIIPLGILMYFLLMKLDGVQINKLELETVMLTIFYLVCFYFIQFKNALLNNGAAIIWQNIPNSILNNYFVGVDLPSYILAVGFVPLFFGVYTIYRYTFKINKPIIEMFIGNTIVVFVLLLLKFVQPQLGLLLIAVNLTILSGEGLKLFLDYVRTTKVSSLKFLALSIIIIVFIFTSVQRTVNVSEGRLLEVPDQDMINILTWMQEHGPKSAVIFSDLNNGHLITGFAKRRNVIDDNFMFIKKPATIMKDMDFVLETNSQIEAVKILNKYSSDYILIQNNQLPRYFIGDNCFEEKIKNDKYSLYELLCKVQEIE